MRRLLIIPLAAAALAIAGHTAAQPQTPPPRARLSFIQRSPLKVRGAGFHRRERVRVVARVGAGAPLTRHVRARRSGSFVVSFSGQSAAPCGLLIVRATGAQGSRAAIGGRSPECMVR